MGSFHFGPFHLDGARRLLFCQGQVVSLVPKALELLELLIAERQRTVSKAELLERLWPDTVVADNNLTVTMSALRKALGESAAQPRYVQTLSRRGYRFVEPLATPAEPTPTSPAGLQRSPSRAGRAAEERTGPSLVGREAQQRHLERRLGQALGGTGRVVFVTGEPGIGKTALCESFLATVVEQEVILLRGRSLEQFGRREAYLPWLEAWGALLTSAEGERARVVLRQAAPSWCREFPALFPEAAERPAQDITRDRLLREMGDALAALAAARPLLIVLEDLHWADAASCDLLRWVSQRSAQQRWLLIGTFRSVEAGLLNAPLESLRREALQHDECDELRLGPLAAAQVSECLRARFASNDFPAELSALLYRRTEGHPLFLTRLLSFLEQHQVVVLSAGVWRLAQPLERLELEAPEDVRAMVRRKLDSSSEEQRQMLCYASVEGNEFSSRVLAELLGMDGLVLEERLQPLESQHRLIETLGQQSWPDGVLSTRYRFAHVLYQNELYASLTSGRRALLHRRVAELSSASCTDAERSRLAATLAVHFERGRDLPRAIEHMVLAGQNAHRLCAYGEEERLYTRALELCEQLPEPERPQRMAAALLGLVWAVYDAGDPPRADQILLRLLEHARQFQLPEAECEALRCLYSTTFFYGRLAESEAYAQAQLRVATAHGLQHYQLQAHTFLVGFLCARGSFSAALARAEELRPLVEASADRHLDAMLWMNVGWSHSFQSRFAAAEQAFLQAQQYWTGISRLMVLGCWRELGWIRPHLGQLAAGLEAFERALGASEPEFTRYHARRGPDGCGWILREAGDYAGALAHHRAGLEKVPPGATRFFELSFTIELSADLLALGDAAGALAALERAQALFAAGSVANSPSYIRRVQLRLLTAQARAALASGDHGTAGSTARALLELAALDPSHEHQIQAHELLARVALERGDPARARASVSAALRSLQQFPSVLLGWRSHALAAQVHLQLGEHELARGEAQRAGGLIAQLAADLRSVGLEQSFSSSPPVRAALALGQ